MKTNLLKAGALSCALLATTCLTAPALAQSVDDGGGGDQSRSATLSPPPERFAVSPGARSGNYTYRQTDLSIGEDSEAGGLALTRSGQAPVGGHTNPFGNFSHNWDIMVTEKRLDLENPNSINGGHDYRIMVHFGGRSETFESKYSDTFFELKSRNGRAALTFTGDKSGPNVVYTFTASDGTTALFRPLGSADCSTHRRCAYVSQVVLPDGTRFDFAYEAGAANATRLRRVTSSRGYALLLQYGSGADASHVVAACTVNLAVAPAPADHSCPAGAAGNASYGYTSFGNRRRLASATDAGGGAWGFTYSGTQQEFDMGFVRPGETAPWLVNRIGERLNNEGGTDEIVGFQSFADGSSYSYGFELSPQVEGEIPQLAGGTWTDAAGNYVQLSYGFHRYPQVSSGIDVAPINVDDVFWQITPGPEQVRDQLGRVTITDYCDPNAMANLPSWENHRCIVQPLAVSSTDPEEIRTVYGWDFAMRNLGNVRRIPKPGSLQPDGTPMPDILTSATYDCSSALFCAKPTSVTDARGNVTEFTYSAQHGGLLTETRPAAPNGVRPQTRHRYDQLQARLADGSAAGPPVWLLVETSICRTSAATGNPAAPCAAAGDEVRTTFDYGPATGPNNLLLRGQVVTADGQSWRTCYGYDARGRRISETGPGAELPQCQ